MARPTFYDMGGCYVVDEAGVRIRVTSPDDQTADARITYDSDCRACYLGFAHSGDYHAHAMIAARKENAR